MKRNAELKKLDGERKGEQHLPETNRHPKKRRKGKRKMVGRK